MGRLFEIRLKEVLNAESAALGAGDFEALLEIQEKKEKLLSESTFSIETSTDQIERIKDLASRNVAALDAARTGIEAALLRISELRKAASGYSVYSSDGRKLRISAGDVGQ